MHIRLAALVTVLALSTLPTASAEQTVEGCTPTRGVDWCLPTPEQCATGAFNGHWVGTHDGRWADCVGGDGHIQYYFGGDAHKHRMTSASYSGGCGTIVEADVTTFGDWSNPNLCLDADDEPGGAGQPGKRFREAVRSSRGVVVSHSPEASAAGIELLNSGGNAVDAAVATMFALAVTSPMACGIGGGGFLVYRGADGEVATLDFREGAPQAADGEDFTKNGQNGGPGVLPASTGHRIAGVPGVVRGMAAVLERFGKRSLAQTIDPAEELAREGFAVPATMYMVYFPTDTNPSRNQVARFQLYPETAKTFLEDGARPLRPGYWLRQEQLAWSLGEIAAHGPSAFYEGSIADLIVADMDDSRTQPTIPGDEGLITRKDLADYRAIWRDPLIGTYRGNEIITMGPPASGIFAVEALNILEGFDLGADGHSSPNHVHRAVETEKLAWADRVKYVADPDYEPHVPTATLASKDFAASRRALINSTRAQRHEPGQIDGTAQGPPPAAGPKDSHTAHISVIDKAGNAVSVTCTIGAIFGNAVVVPKTGVLLGNGMDGFSARGTVTPNVNQPAGGKRPRSAMTPLIVVDPAGVPLLLSGGAGGPTIPMGVLHTVLNVVDFGMDIGRAVDAARFTSQVCCTIRLEDFRIPDTTEEKLKEWGHTLVGFPGFDYGRVPYVQVAGVDPSTGMRLGSSDPRDTSRGATAVVKTKERGLRTSRGPEPAGAEDPHAMRCPAFGTHLQGASRPCAWR